MRAITSLPTSVHDLRTLVRSFYPLILVETVEETAHRRDRPDSHHRRIDARDGRADEPRELLEPERPHRARAVALIMAAGRTPPRHGPRLVSASIVRGAR